MGFHASNQAKTSTFISARLLFFRLEFSAKIKHTI
jgi:hypothetical protein